MHDSGGGEDDDYDGNFDHDKSSNLNIVHCIIKSWLLNVYSY
jgi:hypothetical protein